MCLTMDEEKRKKFQNGVEKSVRLWYSCDINSGIVVV